MRTLYNIYNTPMVAIAQKAMVAMGVLLLVSCAVDKVKEDIPEIDLSGTDPISFTCKSQDEETEFTTRASVLLASDFMVSTYKAFGQTKHSVMENYHVEYLTAGTAWDGNVRPYWDYTGVAGQYERFWDYSAFPYRFHAIAPYPKNKTNYILSDNQLNIPEPYYAQTTINGMITPADNVAEPHLLAQVQRNTDGTDQDLLGSNSVINNASTSRNREVWLPFHHLNSKIRFGIYHTTQWLTANKTYINHLVIKVVSASFVTEALSGYKTENNGSWHISNGNSGFQGLKKEASSINNPYQIYSFDGGLGVEGNDLTLCQTRQTAYFMQCPGGIMQIPQEKVRMTVSFDLMKEDGNVYQEFRDVPIQLIFNVEPTVCDEFNWQSGYIYTYYLVLGEVENKLEITFTATLTPWEDVTGSLTTDLEQ